MVPFIYCQSYRRVKVNLDPPKGTQKVPGIHFEKPCRSGSCLDKATSELGASHCVVEVGPFTVSFVVEKQLITSLIVTVCNYRLVFVS